MTFGELLIEKREQVKYATGPNLTRIIDQCRQLTPNYPSSTIGNLPAVRAWMIAAKQERDNRPPHTWYAHPTS